VKRFPKIALATTLVAVLLQQGTARAAAGSADLSVSVSTSAEPTTANSDLTYTITLVNNGPGPAASTNIHDILPPEVMLISVGGAGRYDPALNRVTWHLGTVDAGRVTVRTVVIRPIHPNKITNSVTVTTTSTDPTTPDRVDTPSHVVGELGVEYISVRDAGVKPAFRNVPLGSTLQWDFFGPGVHEITDSHGLGLFDSGPTTSVNYFRYTFELSAEIRTMDIGYPDNNGKIVVPVQVSPSSGDLSTQFAVTWALSPLPADFVEDVQIKRPGSTAWQRFRHGTTELNDPSFLADSGPGTYSFRDRIRNTANNTHSRFGPPVPIDVVG
jgi:uncharacterized repeat protein (TIGR01451 family)